MTPEKVLLDGKVFCYDEVWCVFVLDQYPMSPHWSLSIFYFFRRMFSTVIEVCARKREDDR